MTEQEKRMNRETKGRIMELLAHVPESERKELIEKYRSDKPTKFCNGTINHKIITGTWFNWAVKAAIRNASDDEIHQIIRVICVCIDSAKYNLDVSEAILKEGMNDILVKYVRPTLIEERKKKDRQKQLDLAAKMTTVLEMHEKGFTNQRIGEILGIPESTVRFFVKHKGGVKATGYTINKVEE